MKLLSATCCLLSALALAACATDTPYNTDDFANGGPDAPLMNERTAGFMTADNNNYEITSVRPKTDAEKNEMNDKWETSRKDTHWQQYKGTMVRIEVLLGATDTRDMRLKIIQNASGADQTGNNASILSAVSDYEMKHVCGRNAKSYTLIYDKPSFDVLRPTPYFDYLTTDDGTTMREYGFRCVY